MTTKRVIDHTADNESGEARATVREVIRALQVLPGDYKLRRLAESWPHPITTPISTVDVDHETQEVTFG